MLAEDPDGIDIHPHSKWTFRRNPGENVAAGVFATKFGKPLPRQHIQLDACDVNCASYIGDGPKVNDPPLDIEYLVRRTNDEGIASFIIHTKNPNNPRKYIDGQVYFFAYSIHGKTINCFDMCKTDFMKLLNSLIVILVWDSYTTNGKAPTWIDDIYPIFKQYANLYPVMTNNFVDLGNYYDVLNYRERIKQCFLLDFSDPNYMPATRDLSKSKRDVILRWFENPLIGTPTSYYNVEDFRKHLNIAIQLELATIPPYLTAWASIKPSYNQEVQRVLRHITIQEMMHVAVVANIINAVGGKPSFFPTPKYPTHLPGGVQPDLVVPIEKISIALIRNIFMEIEEPEWELQEKVAHVWEYADRNKFSQCQKNKNGPSCKDETANKRYSNPKANGDLECLYPSDVEQILQYGVQGRCFVFQR